MQSIALALTSKLKITSRKEKHNKVPTGYEIPLTGMQTGCRKSLVETG